MRRSALRLDFDYCRAEGETVGLQYMARYIQRVDEEGFSVRAKEIVRLACCDCGLVHDFVFVADRKGNIGIAARRNNRATAAKRRSKPRKR